MEVIRDLLEDEYAGKAYVAGRVYALNVFAFMGSLAMVVFIVAILIKWIYSAFSGEE